MTRIRAVFLDAGNTVIYPRMEVVIAELKKDGLEAQAEDFFATERHAKRLLDEWLWPQIRQGEVPREIDHYFWGAYLREITRRLGAPEPEPGKLTRRLIGIFQNIHLWSRVLPDTPALLDWLAAQGYFVGVISNSTGTLAEQLERLGLARHFRTVLDSALVGVQKPHPEIFQLALERAGVEGSETVFVGDTYSTDVGGAELAGLRGVLIDSVGAYPEATCPRITALPELKGILEAW